MVIVYADIGAKVLDVALFGVSGRATAAMATTIVQNAQVFWPPNYQWRGKSLGVYVCKFLASGRKAEVHRGQHLRLADIVALEDSVLAEFIR